MRELTEELKGILETREVLLEENKLKKLIIKKFPDEINVQKKCL